MAGQNSASKIPSKETWHRKGFCQGAGTKKLTTDHSGENLYEGSRHRIGWTASSSSSSSSSSSTGSGTTVFRKTDIVPANARSCHHAALSLIPNRILRVEITTHCFILHTIFLLMCLYKYYCSVYGTVFSLVWRRNTECQLSEGNGKAYGSEPFKQICRVKNL